ncbi:hypothetical protein GCM10017624_41760 [Azotobacter vinelandii]|nr:hypothetical protein GCM10017624_41760 [Azotobacter vinelandii]
MVGSGDEAAAFYQAVAVAACLTLLPRIQSIVRAIPPPSQATWRIGAASVASQMTATTRHTVVANLPHSSRARAPLNEAIEALAHQQERDGTDDQAHHDAEVVDVPLHVLDQAALGV